MSTRSGELTSNAHFTAPTTPPYPASTIFGICLDSLRDRDTTEMESAAKRKAASASVGDNDGRPAKRQKVPVRAAPESVDCIVGGGRRDASSGGCDAGWASG
jgi:hypothetical protein